MSARHFPWERENHESINLALKVQTPRFRPFAWLADWLGCGLPPLFVASLLDYKGLWALSQYRENRDQTVEFTSLGGLSQWNGNSWFFSALTANCTYSLFQSANFTPHVCTVGWTKKSQFVEDHLQIGTFGDSMFGYSPGWKFFYPN